MAKGKGRGRRRKTVDEADVSETRTAEAEPRLAIDGDRLLVHINAVKGVKQKLEHYQSELRTTYKTMKAEGIDPEVVRTAIKLEKIDATEYRAYLEQLGVMFRATGQPFQINVFDTAFGDAVKQAEHEARQAASAGRAMDCRWAEGTPERDAYEAEYARVQGEMAMRFDRSGAKPDLAAGEAAGTA